MNSPERFEILSERPADVAAIRIVTNAAFGDSPHGNHHEADTVDALRATREATS